MRNVSLRFIMLVMFKRVSLSVYNAVLNYKVVRRRRRKELRRKERKIKRKRRRRKSVSLKRVCYL